MRSSLSLAPGSWWLPTRAAARIDTFRFAIGAALVARFVMLKQTLPGVIGSDGMYWGGGAALGLWDKLSALDTQTLQWLLNCGLTLAVAITIGVFPRGCAALLFVLSVHIARRAFPTSSLDDHLACTTLFWLCLAPIDGAWSRRRAARVDGWTSSLWLVYLLLIQMDASLWRVSTLGFAPSRWMSLMMCATVAGSIAPYTWIRASAVIALVALHGWLLTTTPLVFTHVLFIASAILLWGERSHCAQAMPVGAAPALGAIVLLLSISYMTSSALGWPLIEAASSRWLSDAGLLPITSGASLKGSASELEFSPQLNGQGVATLRAHDFANGPRAEIVLRYLASHAPEHRSMRELVANTVVRAHCRASTSARELGELSLRVGSVREQIAWYDCAAPNSPPRVVLRDVAAVEPRAARAATEKRSSSL